MKLPAGTTKSRSWLKIKCPGWRRDNEYRHKLFEGHKPRGPGERTLDKKGAELARVRERLQVPDLRPGIARELRKHIAILEREIAELEK
jgi:hypothetical protein